jgi:hypothetical protein
MGRVDPSQLAAGNVQGGAKATVDVKFEGVMSPGLQDPVTYSGDLDAIQDNPPNACPWPACQYGEDECEFQVATKVVTSPKQVTVSVHGPSVTKHTTFTISP